MLLVGLEAVLETSDSFSALDLALPFTADQLDSLFKARV